MTEVQALQLLEKYLKGHGFTPKRLDPRHFEGKKVPDFIILEKGKALFICEVKSPRLILNKKTGLYQHTTTASKLREMMHKSVKQFSEYDSDRKFSRVLVFISDQMILNWTKLAHSLNGVVGFEQTIIKDMRNMGFIERTNSDLEEIELIIWLQISEKSTKIIQYVPFINKDSKRIRIVERIQIKLKPTKDDDIVDRNSRKYQ